MANDKLFLRCLHCKKTALLAKYYPSNYGAWDRGLSWFIDKHMSCSPAVKRQAMDLEGDKCFEVINEAERWHPKKRPELQQQVLGVVGVIGDPLMKHIVERIKAPEEDIKAAVRSLVAANVLRMKEDTVDHDWAYVRTKEGLEDADGKGEAGA